MNTETPTTGQGGAIAGAAAGKPGRRAKNFKPGRATSGYGRATRAEAAAAVHVHVGPLQTLGDFRDTAGELTIEERGQIAEQALVMLEQIYVHLPLKRAMHAVDPIQRLKLLQLRIASMTESAFHAEMISIYSHLRDLHTSYVLPLPYQLMVAALPFRIEEYFEGGARKYVVTQVSPIVKDRSFKPGVMPTHWGRKFTESSSNDAGKTPSATMRCSA